MLEKVSRNIFKDIIHDNYKGGYLFEKHKNEKLTFRT